MNSLISILLPANAGIEKHKVAQVFSEGVLWTACEVISKTQPKELQLPED